MRRYMTIRQITPKTNFRKYLGVSEATFWRLSQEPDFPKKVMLSKRLVGYFEDEIEAYISSRQVGGAK